MISFLELQARHFNSILEQVSEFLSQNPDLSKRAQETREDLFSILMDESPNWQQNQVAVYHRQADLDGKTVSVLVRVQGTGVRAVPEPVRYIWVLLTPRRTHPQLAKALEFSKLMESAAFRDKADQAPTLENLLEVYSKSLDERLAFLDSGSEELQPTGRFLGGIRQDLKRRLPVYWTDFRDGLNSKVVAAVFFLFFACLAPAIAFGGLLSVLTKGEIGAIEMLVATTVCGIVYSLFSGQPLTILGSTGPVIIFMGLLHPLTEKLGIPYLPTLAWIGLWTMVILLLLAAADACAWIRYFTRFTDEIFAALISIIFIMEALKELVHIFNDPKVRYDTALLSLILALGTYEIATRLAEFRSSPYLRGKMREFLADFGPAIAIGVMTGVALLAHAVDTDTLQVPSSLVPSQPRAWFVNPLSVQQKWIWVASIIPALFISILLYLDQNITARLVNNPDNKLKKGAGYHLDLLVVALLVGFCSLLGLPWMVAATVRSLNHVNALSVANTDEKGRKVVSSVLESRLSGLMIHVLIGVSLLFLSSLQKVPMSVLFGLFLYMGVTSMKGSQFFERLRLWVMDRERYPTHSYIRAVPNKTIHRFTAIQLVCLAVLWFVKSSPLGILFPVFIGLLIPVRMALNRYFEPEHLALLDAEKLPEEDEFRVTD
ncbi:MAG: sodium bicarbonate transporter family protein [Vulcanimicrobiota bacterium]